ncbi:YggT family protein [Arthrobacter sp. C9C5]|uniref:YggT family protein n=1 Tax=Arthrobacter sp. C9C5 TaxID=2735267 RepID=UPI00158539D6|nr:YggT family protein [Arthrobacter sp. C9C5]NUU30815.1 YggT family protein [Arthrobacter sp. C9C5]
MGIVFGLVYIALLLFFVALIIRLIFDWVQMFARSWRPRGVALVTAHAVYSITDKPLKLLGRILPPLRLGGISLDLAFLVLFLAVSVAMGFARYLTYAQPIAT